MNPLFSIILTTHNRQQFLPRAIHSVLQQTFSDFELIIIDDYSTDNTPQLMTAFHDTRINYIRLDYNQGVSAARNRGIQLAKGEYISFLDDDDEYLPGYLQEIVNFLKIRAKPLIGLIWTGIAQVFAKNNRANQNACIKTELFDLSKKNDLSFVTRVLFSGITLHRICFELAGVFDLKLNITEDTDLILRMLAANLDYAAIPKVLFKIHIHDQPSLSRNARLHEQIDTLEDLMFRHDKFLSQHKVLWLHFYHNLAGDYYRIGKPHSARKILGSILKKRWYYLRAWDLFRRFEFKYLKARFKQQFKR